MPDPDGRPPLRSRFVSDARAQSETVGVVLLLGLVITGSGTVLLFGADAIESTKESTDLGQAEHAMTQLDSKASLVAHGSADTQRLGLGRPNRGTLRVREDAGWMRVTIHNEIDGTENTVLNESLGAVVYERGRMTIAYQGGGVWRARGEGSVMVSPPEFHYKDGTLTLPLVLVRGESLSGGNVVVRQQGATDGRYPDPTDASRSNPMEEGTVNVTVGSRYYRAWGKYFAERTSGNVTYDHSNGTVRVKLITPFKEEFENAAATTQQGGITVNGNDLPPSPSETGVNYPLADSRIESRIADCEAGNCTAWSGGDINSGGRYYASSSIGSDAEIDAAGDVELVVDGSFDAGDIDVTGSGNVTVYAREDFSVNDGVNDGGDPSQFRTLVHSDGDVDLNGNVLYAGLIYAPGSHMDFNGNAEIIGGVVAETLNVNGNPNELQYDPDVNQIDLNFDPDAPPVLYLHVSVTEVEITD